MEKVQNHIEAYFHLVLHYIITSAEIIKISVRTWYKELF